jgi:hypothetical protein
MGPIHGVDLPDFRQLDACTWVNDEGDAVTVSYFGLPPDLPAPLEDLPRLRWEMAHGTARAGGTLVEVNVQWFAGLPALVQINKFRNPGQRTGLIFLGSFTVPRATCSVVVKVQSVEHGTTGIRESIVAAEVGFEQAFLPHPFAPELRGPLPFNRADDPCYDARFPQHPLSRTRRLLGRLASTVRTDPAFAALPPFVGPPPAPQTTR